MPFPCRVNSHMPCRTPAILRQCRVLRESPRGRRKYPNCIWDWFASGNNLRRTPRCSRKKPNAGRSPTCRLWTADANSHIPCRPVPWPWEVAFRTARSWHGIGTARARHGMCESDTAALCKSNGKDTIWTLSGTAWERHGMCGLAFRFLRLHKIAVVKTGKCLLAQLQLRFISDVSLTLCYFLLGRVRYCSPYLMCS
jgi:hypothetical protein